MARRLKSWIATASVAFTGLQPTTVVFAQAADTRAAPAAAEGKPAVIERAPLVLRPAEKFQIPLHLEAAKSIDLAARRDGAVASVLVKLGDKVQVQAEAVRLDTQERQLELKRAQAAHKAALAEQTKSPPNDEGAAARVDVAKADLELAQLRLEQCNVHTPISGTVVKIHVVDGEFVTAGQPLVTIIDSTQLRAEVPIDAKAISVGNSVPLKVEDESVNGTVLAIIPLSDRFEPLRDLFLSVASGIVIVDNGGGKLRAGQTVYSSLIPRVPVAEAPSAALSNTGDGSRKVQVIRDGFVRDVKVELLGQVGDDHVFVSGRFGPTDELVLKSSEPLLDGARVVAQNQTAAGAEQKPATQGSRGSKF
jgi:multidrug efflux pump subunit AcrA (membrane-fusion protein)